MNIDTPAVLITVITLVVTVALGGMVFAEVTSGDVQDNFSDGEQWCENRNGIVVMSNVIGEHGGLHCDLPNGTLVHFHDMDFNGSEKR